MHLSCTGFSSPLQTEDKPGIPSTFPLPCGTRTPQNPLSVLIVRAVSTSPLPLPGMWPVGALCIAREARHRGVVQASFFRLRRTQGPAFGNRVPDASRAFTSACAGNPHFRPQRVLLLSLSHERAFSLEEGIAEQKSSSQAMLDGAPGFTHKHPGLPQPFAFYDEPAAAQRDELDRRHHRHSGLSKRRSAVVR